MKAVFIAALFVGALAVAEAALLQMPKAPVEEKDLVAFGGLSVPHGHMITKEEIAAGVSDAANVGKKTCKKTTVNAGPCTIQLKVCGGFHRRKWRFSADACASDVCAHVSGFKGGKGAAKQAVYKLLTMKPACACKTNSTAVGKCTFSATGCFQQTSPGAESITYSAAVTCTNNQVTGSFCCDPDVKESFKNAFADLSTKMNVTAVCL